MAMRAAQTGQVSGAHASRPIVFEKTVFLPMFVAHEQPSWGGSGLA